MNDIEKSSGALVEHKRGFHSGSISASFSQFPKHSFMSLNTSGSMFTSWYSGLAISNYM